jgi:uncharacterized membrane protein YjdF
MDHEAAIHSLLHHRLKRFELPFLILLTIAIIAFLLKLPYLPTGLIAGLILLLVVVGYGYLRILYGLSIPLVVALLLIAAVQVDALGNYFHMYGREFGPVMYDEFSHFATSGLTIPAIIWLLKAVIERRGYRLSLGLITLFGITCSYSAAAFYEVIELWDELYFSGKRIWSPYDAPNDLQWDLAGKLVGALVTYLVFKLRAPSVESETTSV